jgi:hypothetical protein
MGIWIITFLIRKLLQLLHPFNVCWILLPETCIIYYHFGILLWLYNETLFVNLRIATVKVPPCIRIYPS